MILIPIAIIFAKWEFAINVFKHLVTLLAVRVDKMFYFEENVWSITTVP